MHWVHLVADDPGTAERIATDIADITSEFVDAEAIVIDYVKGPGEKTPQGLATELRRESTFLIPDEKAPLMDRALSAVMNVLKSSSREEK